MVEHVLDESGAYRSREEARPPEPGRRPNPLPPSDAVGAPEAPETPAPEAPGLEAPTTLEGAAGVAFSPTPDVQPQTQTQTRTIPLAQRRDLEGLTPEELTQLGRAFARMQAAPGPRGYDALAGIHGLPHMRGQHHTPSFLAWHRAFLLHFELGLRAIDPDVALPWWDFTSAASRSAGIPPAFTAEPLRSAALPQGLDPTGSAEPIPAQTWREPSDPGLLPTAAEVDAVMAIADFTVFQALLEEIHDRVHAWIGGSMGSVLLGSYDPLFYPMHAYVDRLFWQWQSNPEHQIPAREEPLGPFDLTLADVVDIAALGYTYGATTSPGDSPELAVLAGYRADTAQGEDLLDVGHDVAALCCLLTAKSIEPPISVGLFGEWGSGKSFFMEQMRSWIREASARSAAAENDRRPTLLCSSVKQVTFNAWHYTDANLWASLVVRLFEGLGEPDVADLAGEQAAQAAADAKATRDKLFKKLPLYREQLEVAQHQHDAAVGDHQRASDELNGITKQLQDAELNLQAPETPDEAAIEAAGDEVVRQGVVAIRAALP
ncbi:MAG: tyrosinase, partial [Acidimicrobiaceae bacterium]|nr:tyrosinase [Acidimicrobiaceae bacterium]